MKTLKVLVPVDFSKTSHSAFVYASHLSEKINAEITLLTVISGNLNTNLPLIIDPVRDHIDASKKRLKYFAEEYSKDENIFLPEVSTKIEVRIGLPGFTIPDYAKDNQFDLIIMGTRDKHGILDRILGSTSSTVIKLATIPTILIHQNTGFQPLNKILFAHKTTAIIENARKKYNQLNNYLNCETEFLLVDETENIFELIIRSSEEKKADMIALVHQHKGLFEGFFKESKSIKVAQKAKLPVMILPEYKEE